MSRVLSLYLTPAWGPLNLVESVYCTIAVKQIFNVSWNHEESTAQVITTESLMLWRFTVCTVVNATINTNSNF